MPFRRGARWVVRDGHLVLDIVWHRWQVLDIRADQVRRAFGDHAARTDKDMGDHLAVVVWRGVMNGDPVSATTSCLPQIDAQRHTGVGIGEQALDDVELAIIDGRMLRRSKQRKRLHIGRVIADDDVLGNGLTH